MTKLTIRFDLPRGEQEQSITRNSVKTSTPSDLPSAPHQEHELSRMLEHVPAVISYWDTTLHCRSCNRMGTRWWGIPREAIVGMHASKLLGPLYSLNLPRMERALRGEPQQFEREIPDPRGGPARSSLIDYTPDIVDGVVRGFFVLVTDVSELKQAQLALRAGEAHLQQILDTAATGLTRCNRDLRCISANRAYAEIAGLPVDQIVGRSLVEILGPEALETIRPYIDSVLRGETVVYEREMPVSTGRPRVVHVVCTPWRECDGTVSGWVASITDISDVVAARRAEQRVVQQLRESDRRKDEFLAMLSHELRNPLGAISNAGEVLRRLVPSSAGADIPLQILRRQTAQLSRLVDDLLDTVRIARGRIRLEDKPVALEDVVCQAVETVRPLAHVKSQRLQVSNTGEALYVRGDRARLVQSIGNILDNAAKYTDDGGEIELDVSASEQEITITVRDTGKGISPDVLPHVFDPFVQDPRTLNRSQGGGLGLGLSLVKRIIAMHHGTVQAESAGLGRGSTFIIQLPRLGLPDAGSVEIAATPRAPVHSTHGE
jgi:PAS domain S-box-containing protein